MQSRNRGFFGRTWHDHGIAGMVGLVCMLATPVIGQDFILSDRDEWSETTDIDPSSPEGRLDRIRRALADEDYERADNLASQWIDRFPRHPSIANAYLYRGDSERGRGNYYESLFDYEYIATNFSGAEVYLRALERELEIARLFADGLKRKLWGIRMVDASEEAEELFIRVQERMPGSTLAEDAGIALGDYYFSRRSMTLATEAYSLFIENYPQSRHISKARRRLIYAYLALFKGPEFDSAGLYEARAQIQNLEDLEPATAQKIGTDAMLQRIDDSVAWKMVTTAEWYIKSGDVISAEMTLRRMLRSFPRTSAARAALRLVRRIDPKLPEAIRRQAPDYAAFEAAMGMQPASETEKSP